MRGWGGEIGVFWQNLQSFLFRGPYKTSPRALHRLGCSSGSFMSPHSQLTLSPQSSHVCLSLAILLTTDISIILHPKSCIPSILLPEGSAPSSYHIESDLSCFLSIAALEAQGLSKSVGFRLYPQLLTASQHCIVKTHGKNEICHTHWWKLLSMSLSLFLQHRWIGAEVGDPAVDLVCNDHIRRYFQNDSNSKAHC